MSVVTAEVEGGPGAGAGAGVGVGAGAVVGAGAGACKHLFTKVALLPEHDNPFRLSRDRITGTVSLFRRDSVA